MVDLLFSRHYPQVHAVMPANQWYQDVVPDLNAMTKIVGRIAYLLHDPDYGYDLNYPFDPPDKAIQQSLFREIRHLYDSGKLRGAKLNGLFRCFVFVGWNSKKYFEFSRLSTEEKCVRLFADTNPSKYPITKLET
jgi:hypothetical protein